MAREDSLHKLVLKEREGLPGCMARQRGQGGGSSTCKGPLRTGGVHVQDEGRAAQLGKRG